MPQVHFYRSSEERTGPIHLRCAPVPPGRGFAAEPGVWACLFLLGFCFLISPIYLSLLDSENSVSGGNTSTSNLAGNNTWMNSFQGASPRLCLTQCCVGSLVQHSSALSTSPSQAQGEAILWASPVPDLHGLSSPFIYVS